MGTVTHNNFTWNLFEIFGSRDGAISLEVELGSFIMRWVSSLNPLGLHDTKKFPGRNIMKVD